MTKTSQDNDLNYINFLKHSYEYHTEKLKYRDITCLAADIVKISKKGNVLKVRGGFKLYK